MSPNGERKPVFFTARIGPNFLWHMLASARISYDSDYADRYAGTVSEAALEALRRHADLLRFGYGATAPLTGFFSFLPAWLRLETKQEFSRFFASVDRFLREGRLRVFVEDFPDADWLDPAYHHFATEPRAEPEEELRPTCAALASFYLDNFDAYRERVWPEAESAMQPRLAELTEHFDRTDFILAWEDALGLEFEMPGYEIILCYANKNGPDYTSLGVGGNLFYYDKPFDRTWQMVSHEIGTHLLFEPLLGFLGQEKFDPAKLSHAYEVLAMFYNRKILGTEALAYDLGTGRTGGVDEAAVLAFCGRESGKTPPEELLEKIADLFCRG
jgi:hypothetical protein